MVPASRPCPSPTARPPPTWRPSMGRRWAATAAVGITAGLILRGTAVLGILRGTAVLGDARPTVVALLVFLAVLTGMLMPMVSYLSIARDGSKSRNT
jgi:hypothetical protein